VTNSRILPEKLMVAQPVKKFSAFKKRIKYIQLRKDPVADNFENSTDTTDSIRSV
jgi:hypothetical protein